MTPAPRMVELSSLRPDAAPVRVAGYPIERCWRRSWRPRSCSARRTPASVTTPTSTLTGRQDLTHGAVRPALDATARFRGVEVVPLSSLVDDLAELRERTYRAYRTALGVDGAELPTECGEVVDAVTTFADPLARPTVEPRWRAAGRRWTVDVASNVAIGDRRDAAGQRATAPDASVRIGRMTCYLRRSRAVWRSDTIGRGWPPRDAVGRVGRSVVCMAWKRSGVRFPLAPRKTAGQRPARVRWVQLRRW